MSSEMLEIALNRETSFEFELSVTGISANDAKVRLGVTPGDTAVDVRHAIVSPDDSSGDSIAANQIAVKPSERSRAEIYLNEIHFVLWIAIVVGCIRIR